MKRKISALYYLVVLFSVSVLCYSCSSQDYYTTALEAYNNNEYETALNYFKKVEPSDNNYTDAQLMITTIEAILLAENSKSGYESYLEDTDVSAENTQPQIDSVTVKKLKSYFIVKKDEFSIGEVYWYTPKSAPKYTNYNGIYCYFQVINGIASNLRFKVQYCADDWLFFESIQILIDGFPYSYVPDNVEHDNGSGEIWEWFDDQVSSYSVNTIIALSKAKTAKIKFEGDQYHKIKPITANQIKAINQTLELYKAFGGKL